MKQEIISRQELSRWLDGLLPDHTVIAPVHRDGRDFFAIIGSAGEVAWDAGRTANPAKEFFFPASEAIVRWRMAPEGLQVEAPLVERPQVLFGARPCDGMALDVLDRLLLAEPVDPYYQARRAADDRGGLGLRPVARRSRSRGASVRPWAAGRPTPVPGCAAHASRGRLTRSTRSPRRAGSCWPGPKTEPGDVPLR